MRYLNGAAPITADGTGDRESRTIDGLGNFLVDGILRWINTGTGTATLEIIDDFTKKPVISVTVGASDADMSSVFKIPFAYRYNVTGTAGTISITAAVDGDN